MRRLAAALLCALLAAALAAVARTPPVPARPWACSLAEAADVVAARGLAFIGPPWLSEYLLVSRRPGSVVEMSAPVRIGLTRSLASRLYPDVAHVPNATFGSAYLVNVEDLLRRAPAVAVQAIFADRLLAHGLCAVPIGANYGTDAGIAGHAKLYSTIAGSPERGPSLLSRFEGDMGALAYDLAASPDGHAPRVLVMGIARHGAIFAEGGRHPATAFIARAGGVNALLDVRSLGVRLDTERLFALDPDAVFLVQALAGDTPSPEALRSSRMGRLRAVAAGRVFALPTEWTMMDSVVATPSYERWMAERLHPGLPGGSAREALRHAYADEVGVVLPEPWLDDALSEARR